MAKKRIGIKYCGGCNPHYERVEMIKRIKSLIGDRFLFLRHDQQNLNGLVLVNGCPRTCAEENLNQREVPYRLLTGKNDFDNLIDWLNALNKKGEKG